MPAPAISVIVPARDAAATLPRTLAALAGQDLEAPWELIVVDDGSADATPDLAEAAGATVVRLPGGGGPAGARNAGIAASSAPLLAFTDADCTPKPGWLRAVRDALRDADLVMGPVRPDEGVPVGPFDRTLHLEGLSPRFETANLAVRRDIAERAGGFEAFAPTGAPGERGLRPTPEEGHFGEDAVFGWRVRRGGGRIVFAPDAVVHHAVFPRDAAGYIAERHRLRFFPALVREIPELRESLPQRIFLSPRTRRFDLALAGAVAAAVTRRPLALALAVPYVRRDLRTWSWWTRGGVAENAARVAADTVGLAALLRGAAAARRLLL